MKKVEVEKLVSKALIITGAILCIIFGMWLIQQGYFSYSTALAMPNIMIAISVIFAIGAITFIILGIKKDTKFYKFASWSAALAVFSMLLKINYEIMALEVSVKGSLIKFFPVSLCLLMISLIVIWLVTVVKIVRN